MTVDQPIWKPTPERVEKSQMSVFMSFLAEKGHGPFSTYDDLYRWSISDISTFWKRLAEFMKVEFQSKPNTILEGQNIRLATWFQGSTLNFAQHLLRRKDSAPALVHWTEKGHQSQLSYDDLHKKVQALASHFKAIGVKKGDRVAALITNRSEAVIGMLACTSLGAVWSSCSPDFGYQGVLDRFGQIKPTVLITMEGYTYNGRYFSLEDTLDRLIEALPELEEVILIPTLGNYKNSKCNSWQDCLPANPEPLTFEPVEFDHPLYIMYSSGTTGKPKCMVHGTGGTLLQHLKELVLHTDLRPDDCITYFTTCGWMMWNWLISSLAVGAKLVLFDGAPSFPDLGVLFRMIEQEKINIFGTSPKFLSAVQEAGLVPGKDFNLSTLKTILSTGSPLSEDHFQFVYQSIKPDVQLASISGGTDIISCFMLGNPLDPVYSGQLQCRGLGMKVETFNPQGESVVNEVGELVCTAPFPSRPVFFWSDPDGRLYKKAYFDHFQGAWRHGDFVKIYPHGGCRVFGRSDATLNPGGVRIGTAEIYGPVESLQEVSDSLVVGRKVGSDTEIVLFLVMAPGVKLDESLKTKIKTTLKKERSPRHVPKEIYQVPDIPRTISGKKVELAVTRLLHGQEITNRDALKNPETLDYFLPFGKVGNSGQDNRP